MPKTTRSSTGPRDDRKLQAKIPQPTTALEDAERLLRTTLQRLDQALVLLDANHLVRLCNPRARELLQLPEAVLFENASFVDIRAYQNARGDFSLVPAATAEKIKGSDARLFPLIYDWPRPDGRTLEVRRVQLADGSSVNTFTDVTDRRASEAAVRESERLYRLLAEHVTDVVIWSRLDSTRVYVSPSARAVFGYSPDELIGQRGLDLIHPDDLEAVKQVLAQLQAGADVERVLRLRYLRKDGSWVWVEGAFSVTQDDGSGEPNGFLASLRDITERQAAEDQANYLARHDLLTGLPNRIRFHEVLEQQLAEVRASGGTCALLYGDLDRFKAVNDTLGHAVGDIVLKVVAERLQRVLSSSAIAARFGGDEFLILLSGVEADQAASIQMARDIIAAIGEPIVLDGRQVNIGICLGISYAPLDGLTADGLLRAADLALFEAKADASGSFRVYRPAMAKAIWEQQRLEADLRQALLRDELELLYQPIIDLKTDRVSGAEALLRWRHPQKGLIAPTTFIPLAEQLGLINQIGSWALRKACDEAASWPAATRVAVNVSAVQFEQSGLVETVMQSLAASGLAPERLELEITETTLMRDVERVTQTLNRLRTLGVRISLDDFGTGYSSLGYLRKFPFDKLKIDRSFVADLEHPDMQRIVTAIIALGQGLNMTITAEGVETAEQTDLVRREGCDEVQGFYFSRPLTAKDFGTFVGAPARSAHVA